MLNWLVHKFVRNYESVDDLAVRESYGTLAGVMGIVINAMLFLVKLPIGLFMGSVAVMSDAFNNISDMGSSVISVVGARMSSRRPDKEHPFGHGRLEYLSALVVALMILIVGFELLRESAQKLLHPDPVRTNPIVMAILCLSVLLKVWMYSYNKKIGRTIHSGILRATAQDSLNDAAATSVVIAATLIGTRTTFPVDAVAGLLVSGMILFSGGRIVKDTVDQLLGGKPDPELLKKITSMVLKGRGVVGVHDLILHDYGPGRVLASIHAEVPDDSNFLKVHEMVDEIEQRARAELGVPLVIHMDPVSLNNEKVVALREAVTEIVGTVNPAFSLHDFRIVDGENRINVLFDLVVPTSMQPDERTSAVHQIEMRLRALDDRYRLIVQIDDNFVS